MSCAPPTHQEIRPTVRGRRATAASPIESPRTCYMPSHRTSRLSPIGRCVPQPPGPNHGQVEEQEGLMILDECSRRVAARPLVGSSPGGRYVEPHDPWREAARTPAEPVAAGPSRPPARLRRLQSARADSRRSRRRGERGRLRVDERRGHHRDRRGVAAHVLRPLLRQAGGIPRGVRRDRRAARGPGAERVRFQHDVCGTRARLSRGISDFSGQSSPALPTSASWRCWPPVQRPSSVATTSCEPWPA